MKRSTIYYSCFRMKFSNFSLLGYLTQINFSNPDEHIRITSVPTTVTNPVSHKFTSFLYLLTLLYTSFFFGLRSVFLSNIA